MKKNLTYTMTLFLGLLLSSAGCNPQDSPVTKADFYGTWKWTDPNDASIWCKLIIDLDNFTFEDCWNSPAAVIENLTWTSITNPAGSFKDSHPTGYSVLGTLTVRNGYYPLKPDGSGDGAAVGEEAIVWLYLSTDKKSICDNSNQSPDHKADFGPFIKQ